jgi:hypothetical protein
MRRPTLVEKTYGPGFRPVPHREVVAPWSGCGVEGCSDQVYGSIEMYVDDVPPTMDWYTRVLAKLPQNVWTTVGFCQSHMEDVVRRSVYDMQSEPDLWAPWRASPPVLTHPPKLKDPAKLVVP